MKRNGVFDLGAENDISQQRASFNTLCQNLGQASPDEISAILAEREVVKPEPGLRPEVIKRLQKRIAEKSVS
ncbi:MAG: hypothetical protein DRR16_28840 [Candidatus Parabeggiatoa sp. nov. 3]|nr:MAG: hypothetical protein DRR00_08100 [Gammaproteobacteria bacterium]RKZ62744.1 MAG: hypothetical protein DRQ99_18285 [Gammaproteobacteria bacterium]RKZ77879.1 MAG: hypothetical protein DRR16_28840 [Gammaproteobacteria bacterium]